MRGGRLLRAVLPLALSGAALAAAPLSAWLDVPFVAQQKNLCGPASIAMVMEYWREHGPAGAGPAPGSSAPGQSALGEPAPGESAFGEEIVRALAPQSAHGLAASAMVRYFRQHGYRAFAYAGDWNELGHEIAQGRPVIAALRPEGDDELHYIVVAGIDDPGGVALVNDPAQRKLLKEDRAQFEREWKATGNWTLLAVPGAGGR
ncbi:MAG: C39 family peptidase [Acidobacteriota bacterium]